MTQSRRAATRQHARPRARAHRRSVVSSRYLVAAVVVAAGIAWLLLQRTQAGGTPTADGSGFRQLGSVQAADYHALVFSPTDPSTLFFGHHNGVMSSDGGRSWSAAVSRPNFDAMILSASPVSPDVLWMAGHDVFYQSRDNARNWTEVRSNLPGLDLHAFAGDAADPNLLYAFAVGHGLFRSLDAGTTWEPLGAGAPRAPTALATGGSAGSLYVGTEQGVVISSDRGQNFAPPIRVGSSPVIALAAAANSDVLYAGTPKGLYRSADGGQSWTPTGYAGDVAALAVHPTDPERVALVDRRGRVFGKRLTSGGFRADTNGVK